MVTIGKELKTFFHLMESMGFFIEIIDEHTRYIYASPICKEYSNFNEETIIGKSVSEVFNDDNLYLLRPNKSDYMVYKNIPFINCVMGKRIFTLLNETPIPLSDGTTGTLCISKFFFHPQNVREFIDSLEDAFMRENLKNSFDSRIYFDEILTNNEVMEQVIKDAKTVAFYDVNVMIIGETGTGKEMIAQGIHNFLEHKRRKPFVAVNCSAIPDNLFESIFFGTEKGAYTGSLARKGLLEEANNGTLFLDELNSMSKMSQAKLLRVLETKRVRRLGGEKDIPFSCRIISAMNSDPKIILENNELRQDLFYRLTGTVLQIPPLRQRKEDLRLLVDHYIKKFSHETGKLPVTIDDEVWQIFEDYEWPGNVRELRNIIQHGVNIIAADEKIITPYHLPHYFTINLNSKGNRQRDYYDLMEIDLKESKRILVMEFEKEYILNALKKAGSSVTRAAANLGVSRQYLYQMIKKHNILINHLNEI